HSDRKAHRASGCGPWVAGRPAGCGERNAARRCVEADVPRKARTSRRAFRPHRQSKRGSRPKRGANGPRPIYSERELARLSLAQEQARGNALDALSFMRSKGYSLARAAREADLK